MKRRVVITGIGAITSLGQDKESIWKNLLEGKSGISKVSLFDTSNLKVRFAGEIKDFKPEAKFNAKLIRRMDRHVQLAMWATDEALRDSGLDLEKINKDRTGVVIGSGIGGLATWESEHVKFLQQGPGRVSPFLIPMMIPDMAAGMVSIHWSLKGPNYCTSSACASSAHAIGESYRSISYGDADIIVSGGSEAPITAYSLSGFANMRACSFATKRRKKHRDRSIRIGTAL